VNFRRDEVTQPLTTIRVPGEGMPVLGAQPPRNGTLLVEVKVVLPDALSIEALALAQALPAQRL
jgi:DnaJ-class molecular chaperone